MDSNDLLLVLGGLSSLILLVRSLRARVRGWSLVSGLIVAVTLGGLLFFPDQVGIVSGGLWLVFILAPLGGQRWMGRLADQQRYRAASRLTSVLRVLHPMDGWWARPRFFDALELGRAGEVASASAIFEELEQGSPVFGREARIHRLRMQSRWEDVLAWLEENAPRPAAKENAALLPMRLRALGETGRVEDLCALYGAAEPVLARGDQAGIRTVCRLFVLAFAGRPDEVRALYDGPLAGSPQAIRTFWIATAALAHDPHDQGAKGRLRALLDDDAASLRASVERRLGEPLGDTAQLSAEAREVVARVQRERDLEHRYDDRPGSIRASLATIALMVPSAIAFVIEELSGGSTSEDTLRALGAVAPKAVLAGEWYRLGAATILHAGYWHFGMNMLGLWVLGRYVEFALGRVRYVALYLFTGVATMLVVVLLARAHLVEIELLVGASGGIMGLVGATAAVLLRGYRREASTVARRRLIGVASIVVAQTIFDVATPEVSFLSHFLGAVLGFLVASALQHRVTPTARGSAQATAIGA